LSKSTRYNVHLAPNENMGLPLILVYNNQER
jgi:hypothetical protein